MSIDFAECTIIVNYLGILFPILSQALEKFSILKMYINKNILSDNVRHMRREAFEDFVLVCECTYVHHDKMLWKLVIMK